jgi:DnaJ-class molecular chaperone
VNVELVGVDTRPDIERAVSFGEKPRTSMAPPPLPTTRDGRKSLEAATYHDVLDLKQLLDLADKEGRVAVYGNKRNSDTSSVSSVSSSSSGSITSTSSASTSGGASPEPASTSKRRFLPWMRRSRDFDKRSTDTESLSQELPTKSTVSSCPGTVSRERKMKCSSCTCTGVGGW